MTSSVLAPVLAIGTLVSLAGIVYPFRPFRQRWRALLSFVVCFILVGVLTPKEEPSGPAEAERTQAEGPGKALGQL